MKKLLLFACMALSLSASAQFTVWEDDFNDGDISDWTLLDVDGNANGWKAHKDIRLGVPPQPLIVDGTHDVLAMYYIDLETGMGLGGNEDNWAISPAQDLSYYGGTVQLVINMQGAIEGSIQFFDVYISDTPTMASFLENEPVTFEFYRQDIHAVEFTDFTIDISEYAGAGNNEVYFAIVNHNTDIDIGIEINNVKITASDLAGTNDLIKTAAKIKQNPVAETLLLQPGSAGLEGANLQIYNLNGTLVKEALYNEEGVSVSGLASGMYFVTLNNGYAVERLKFIKQ